MGIIEELLRSLLEEERSKDHEREIRRSTTDNYLQSFKKLTKGTTAKKRPYERKMKCCA
jgi:hypothetical protein